MNILVIDDDNEFLKLFDQFLREKLPNITIMLETTAEAGLERVRAAKEGGNSIDLILCDIRLPIMSGLDFASHLKNEKIDIPLAFITVHDTSLLRGHSKTIGVKYFISKDIGIEDMVDKIAKMLLEHTS